VLELRVGCKRSQLIAEVRIADELFRQTPPPGLYASIEALLADYRKQLAPRRNRPMLPIPADHTKAIAHLQQPIPSSPN
jgi:hypothetical protein